MRNKSIKILLITALLLVIADELLTFYGINFAHLTEVGFLMSHVLIINPFIAYFIDATIRIAVILALYFVFINTNYKLIYLNLMLIGWICINLVPVINNIVLILIH
jgi:hypothetical protein